MNSHGLKERIICAIILIMFAILGIGPIPLTSTLGLFIVIFRPRWFLKLVKRIYS